MCWADLVGYLASGLVVLTFYMEDMVSLRIAAIFSNVAFLIYGTSLGLGPVMLLHGLLLPLNVLRLRQLREGRVAAPARRYSARACSSEASSTPVPTEIRKVQPRRPLIAVLLAAALMQTISGANAEKGDCGGRDPAHPDAAEVA